jgi:uncharacterized protein
MIQISTAKVTFRVQPGARHTEVVAISSDLVVKVKVCAPPVEGKANEALLDFLKELLQVRSTQLEIIHGGKSRTKIIQIDGLSTENVIKQLRDLL